MRLQKVVKDSNILASHGDLHQEIMGISYDSRKVQKGDLFVCIEGYKTDGHNYIDAVFAAGAVAVLVQKDTSTLNGKTWIKVADTRLALGQVSSAFFHNPSTELNVIGITGTNGKTTTTHLVKRILEEAGNQVGLIGTIHNIVGGVSYPVQNTTPMPLELQQLFRQMVDAGSQYVVMEVSSHALDLGRVEGVEFDVGVFTNITQDHLDFHENMENYLAAKLKLFTGMGKNGNKSRNKYGIINIDDAHASAVIKAVGGKVITYGINGTADVKAINIQIKATGVSFDLELPGGRSHLALRMTGLFSVYNALAAVAVGIAEGISIERIKTALEDVSGVAGRFELVDEGQEFAVIVDYAHTPDSLENVLKTAHEFVEGRIISVFGCGGDRDKTKRPIMGRVSAELADYTIVTSDNPRSEDPATIVNEVAVSVKELVTDDKYVTIVDRREAIKRAIEMAQKGDLVLIAGKGHETYQILKEETIHFDDREVASEFLRERKK